VQQLVQVTGTALGDDVFDLLIHDVFIARQIVPRAEHADGGGESGAMLHVRKQESVRGARMVRVVPIAIGADDPIVVAIGAARVAVRRGFDPALLRDVVRALGDGR